MIEPSMLLDHLEDRGYDALVHVADSVLAGVLGALDGRRLDCFGANNEGEALAIAAGIALAGGRPAVLLQNSGIGNLLNPLVSLADPSRLPMLLIVGWRGRPGQPDEPQHARMGAVTRELLELVGVSTLTLERDDDAIDDLLDRAGKEIAAGRSCAVLISPGSVRTPATPRPVTDATLSRADVLGVVLSAIPERAAVIATTGHTARGLYALSDRSQHLYVTGAMGCAASVGLGLTWRSSVPVVVLDGDGAALMRLEAMVGIGARRPPRFLHLVLDNGVHDSTGGQPTHAGTVDFPALARAVGYATARGVHDADGLRAALRAAAAEPGPHLLHVRTRPGSLPDLPRVALAPAAVADRFARYLRSEEG